MASAPAVDCSPRDRKLLRLTVSLAKKMLADGGMTNIHDDIRAEVRSQLPKQLHQPLTPAQLATLERWAIGAYELGMFTGIVVFQRLRTGKYPRLSARRPKQEGGAR